MKGIFGDDLNFVRISLNSDVIRCNETYGTAKSSDVMRKINHSKHIYDEGPRRATKCLNT